jgi:TrmH family RNA methyltransferase
MRLCITSVQNPRIKAAAALHDRKSRRAEALMLVEGFHELSLAWNAGMGLQTLFVCEELVRPDERELLLKVELAQVECISVSRAVLEKMTYRENPDAWLGVARIPSNNLENLQVNNDALLVIVEGVEKPGNLGAILRSADAAGAHAVLVCDGRTDAWNPNVVRASKGSCFSLPIIETSSKEAFDWLCANKVSIFSATPSAEILHWAVDMQGPSAIAVGAEKEGLTDLWLRAPAFPVKIPMRGLVNSLNVAQALTLVVYEALRQRSARTY